MKKTLALFLVMLMVLSLAPSVLAAGRGLVTNAFLDEGDTEGGDEEVRHFVEVDSLGQGGVFMFAGYNPSYNRLLAMNNSYATANRDAYEGLGFDNYPVSKDENNKYYVDDPALRNCWEVDYDENDGYIIKNLGNEKYLYLSGFDPVTTSDEMVSWDWGMDDINPTWSKGVTVLKLHDYADEYKENTIISWTGQTYGIFKSGMAAFSASSPFVLLKLDDGEDGPVESYEPPVSTAPGGEEYKLVEYNRETVLEDGASYVFSVKGMALTNKEAIPATLVGAPINPENGVLVQPDAQMCWDAELVSEESGAFMFRNAATGEYLSGARFVVNGVSPNLTVTKEEYAVTNNGAQWKFEFQGVDMSDPDALDDVLIYSLRCTLLENPTARKYVAFDGAKYVMDDDYMGLVIYKLEGKTPDRPWATEEPTTTPVVTDSPDVTGTPDVTDSPDVTNTPDVDVTGTPDLTTEPALDTYTVTFVDWDGKVLAEVEVAEGEAAEAPAEEPTRENWVFAGWDADFTEVTEDMTVKAVYYKLGDVNLNGEPDAGDGTLVLREVVGSSDAPLSELQLKVADVNGTGTIDAGDATMILRHAVGTETIDYGPDAPAEEPEDETTEEPTEEPEEGEGE